VVSIGKEAFRGCVNMTDVIIPDSVEQIGFRAFFHCTGLTNLVIPDSVKKVGEDIFINCTSLKSAVLSKNMKIGLLVGILATIKLYGISAARIS